MWNCDMQQDPREEQYIHSEYKDKYKKVGIISTIMQNLIVGIGDI